MANEFVAAHAPFVEDECLRQGVGCGNPPGAGLPPELFPCSVCGGSGGAAAWKEGRASPRHCLGTLRPHDVASGKHMGLHATQKRVAPISHAGKSSKWGWQGLLGLLEEGLVTAWGAYGKSRKLRDPPGHFQEAESGNHCQIWGATVLCPVRTLRPGSRTNPWTCHMVATCQSRQVLPCGRWAVRPASSWAGSPRSWFTSLQSLWL